MEGDPQKRRGGPALAGELPHAPACNDTYREWRALRADVKAALIRAGEVAKEERD